MVKITAVFILLIFFGSCAGNKTSMIRISITKDSALKIAGLDEVILQELKHDSDAANWQSIIPVYRMPADTDMKSYQQAQPGKYIVKDSTVTFYPDTPFRRNRLYFVRYYQYDEENSFFDRLRKHQKLSDQHYTDLIFKR